MIGQVQADELQAWLADDARAKPLVLDVREPWEHEICSIPDSRLLPMQEIPARWQELPADAAIVVVCHHGMRSLRAAQFLRQHGFAHAQSMRGGIDAWSDMVDPATPRY